MTYQWLSTEMKTGVVIADLPDLEVSSIKKTLGKYDTTTATLPLPTASENWLRATLHGGSRLICLDMNAGVEQGLPIWAGWVTRRPRNLGDTLELSLATDEQYLDRRFVGDSPFTNVGQNSIVQTLIETYIAAGSNGGLPIRVVNLDGDPGPLRTRTEYTDISDKTIYSVLTELAGVDGGVEWTIGYEWQHDPERITLVFYVGSRIGNPVTPGLEPNAVFEAPGDVTDAELLEDYSADNSGNDFLATSTASTDTRPQSDHVIVPDPDRPTFEYRFTPSTSITDIGILNAHAKAKAALLGGGLSTLSLTSAVKNAPRLGLDWGIGDDIGYVIGGTVADRQRLVADDVYIDTFTDDFDVMGVTNELAHPDGINSVPAFPGGAVGIVRATGWQLDFGDVDTVTPIIQGASND
jgi:hypothetical protein